MKIRFLFAFAFAMQAVVMGWQMYRLTHEAFYLGLIGLAEAVPALSVVHVAGYLVDRKNPLTIYRCVVFGSLISALILATSLVSIWTVHQQMLLLLLASFVTGCARGFSQPSLYTLIPHLLSRDQLTQGAALNTSNQQTARVLGPAAAGLIETLGGIRLSTFCILVFLAFALTLVLFLKVEIKRIELKKSDFKTELFSGAVFVFRHPVLLPAMSLDMLSVFFGGVTALLPLFADQVFHVGALGLGILRAAPALGSVMMGIVLSRIELGERAGKILFLAVAGFGLSVILFGLSRHLILSFVFLVMSGGFDCVSAVIRASAVQLISPDHMRGKIAAVNYMFIGSSNEIGEFESGLAAHWMGTVPAVLFGGGMCLLTVGCVAFFSSSLRNLNLKTLRTG